MCHRIVITSYSIHYTKLYEDKADAWIPTNETGDAPPAVRLADRIVLMKDGAVVQIGTPEDILTNPADEYRNNFV